jgi:hypothetical protein
MSREYARLEIVAGARARTDVNAERLAPIKTFRLRGEVRPSERDTEQ